MQFRLSNSEWYLVVELVELVGLSLTVIIRISRVTVRVRVS